MGSRSRREIISCTDWGGYGCCGCHESVCCGCWVNYQPQRPPPPGPTKDRSQSARTCTQLPAQAHLHPCPQAPSPTSTAQPQSSLYWPAQSRVQAAEVHVQHGGMVGTAAMGAGRQGKGLQSTHTIGNVVVAEPKTRSKPSSRAHVAGMQTSQQAPLPARAAHLVVAHTRLKHLGRVLVGVPAVVHISDEGGREGGTVRGHYGQAASQSPACDNHGILPAS